MTVGKTYLESVTASWRLQGSVTFPTVNRLESSSTTGIRFIRKYSAWKQTRSSDTDEVTDNSYGHSKQTADRHFAVWNNSIQYADPVHIHT